MPGAKGPEGLQLYDLYSIPADQPTTAEDYTPVITDVAFATATVLPRNSNAWLSRYTDLAPEVGNSTIIFKPCTGEVLTVAFETNAGGCVFSRNAYQAGFFSIRYPTADDFAWTLDTPFGV